MIDLLKPNDADNFRVQVGKYGQRWYTDPLPACDIAPASEANWPSVSTVKKASGSDWSYVAMKRIAVELAANPARFAGLDEANLYETLKVINKMGLDTAARRGTDVHNMCEQMLRHGKITFEGTASEYRPAIEAFFDKYQPELIAVEVVCIHRDLNGVGYGGTGDAGVRIDGDILKLDWKSRGEDSKHAAYPEEGAQLGAYMGAQYMIDLGVDGEAKRAPVPGYVGGLIVSIKPDGCRAYPIDRDAAVAHWTKMHEWWTARLTERASIGRSWAAKAAKPKAATPVAVPESGTVDDPFVGLDRDLHHAGTVRPPLSTPAEATQQGGALPRDTHTPAPPASAPSQPRVEWIAQRVDAVKATGKEAKELLVVRWPHGPRPPKAMRTEETRDYTDAEVALIEAALTPIERDHGLPLSGDPVTVAARIAERHDTRKVAFHIPMTRATAEDMGFITRPDEGPQASDGDIDDMIRAFAALDVKVDKSGWCPHLQSRAWLGEMATAGTPLGLTKVRSTRRLAIAKAIHALANYDDAVARAALEVVLGISLFAGDTTGRMLAALTIHEAVQLAQVAQALDTGAMVERISVDGAVSLVAA